MNEEIEVGTNRPTVTSEPGQANPSETQANVAPTKEAEAKKAEEDKQVVDWFFGLVYSGAAWLFGKAAAWLFESPEPHRWWVWTKRTYFGMVYTVMVVQACFALYQLFVLLRDERKRLASEPPACRAVEEGPQRFAEWVRHIALVIVCWLGLALFIAFCLASGYVLTKIKEWFLPFFS
jgi:hypothetical protein